METCRVGIEQSRSLIWCARNYTPFVADAISSQCNLYSIVNLPSHSVRVTLQYRWKTYT